MIILKNGSKLTVCCIGGDAIEARSSSDFRAWTHVFCEYGNSCFGDQEYIKTDHYIIIMYPK